MPTAEILTIGTELLLGETVDTNTRFIARTLRAYGIDLYQTLTVGDNADRIAEAVRQAMGRADILITTGGLGPTVDDPTRQAIASAVGVELEFQAELWRQITARIARYGRTPGENQKRQAYIPKGARVIKNPVGTAPAFIVEKDRCTIISLPGVPSEMETLLTHSVLPYLKKQFQLHEVISVRTLHTSGLGEGVIDELVGDLETLANPTVGLTAHSGIVDIRIAAKAATGRQADRLITRLEQDIRSRLGKAVYGTDEEMLEGVVLQALASRGWTLGCVESGLGGSLLNRMSAQKSAVYFGGKNSEFPAQELEGMLKRTQKELSASVGLGVVLVRGRAQQEIHLLILSPTGRFERTLSYGGHPQNAARWAANMALDRLRKIALDLE